MTSEQLEWCQTLSGNCVQCKFQDQCELSRRRGETKIGYKRNERTLCWQCARAYPNHGCSWADKFSPVDGWDAIPTKIHSGVDCKGRMRSYHVVGCPLFEQETTRKARGY